MGNIVGVKKKWCDCVGCEFEHWIVQFFNGDEGLICPCCGHITITGRWKK